MVEAMRLDVCMKEIEKEEEAEVEVEKCWRRRKVEEEVNALRYVKKRDIVNTVDRLYSLFGMIGSAAGSSVQI